MKPPSAFPFRRWTPPASGAAILFGLSLVPAAIQLVHWGLALHLPGYSDFGYYYLIARMGMHDGWSTLYNLAVEQREWQALGGVTVLPMFPWIYAPPTAWMVAPLTLLPLGLALAVWETLILGLFLWIWTAAAPGTRLQRWTLLALAIGTFAVAFGLMLGNAVIVALASVVGAWWLVRRQQQVAAGLVLVLIVMKPQVAFFVPFALLAAGYWKTFGVWAAGAIVVAALAMVSLGPDGVHAYQARLHDASSGAPEYLLYRSMTVPGLLGRGWTGLAGQCMMAALALFAAYRRRRDALEFPIIAGLLGSLLITPYLHIEDLTVLMVAGFLYLRTDPPRLSRPILVVGYLLVAGYFQLAGALATGLPPRSLLQLPWMFSQPLGDVTAVFLLPLEMAWLVIMVLTSGARAHRATVLEGVAA